MYSSVRQHQGLFSIEGPMSQDRDLLVEQRGRCGVATLNRPRALNALSYPMIAELEAHYIKWAVDPFIYGAVLRSSSDRAFCSGGDLKTIYKARETGKLDTILERYASEYQHNWTLDRFMKPHVALMNGIVFGGGVGASLYGTHKVAGENYRLAMPEVRIGFFPDVGATYFLPRMPGQIGLYLALTGEPIDRADAYALGLLTHCIDASEFDDICEALSEAEPVDPLLDSRHTDPGSSQLLAMQDQIDRYFSQSSVDAILSALDDASGEEAEWAKETAAIIRRNSPLSLKVAFRQLTAYGQLSLDAALALEARIAYAFLTGEELYEGVRALLVEKDGNPNWSPAKLEDVSDEMVDTILAAGRAPGFSPINPFA